MNILVLMDPLEKLMPQKDSTLLLIKAALENKHKITVFHPHDWFWQNGEVFANLRAINLLDTATSSWEISSRKNISSLISFDIILMRQNPPVDAEYLYASYALDWASNLGVVVTNRPQAIRACNEKFAIIRFPDIITKTLVSSDREKLSEFWEEEQEVVYKPLNTFGGENVFFVGKDRKNLHVIVDILTNHGRGAIMAQKYIPEIAETGDKRILMIHGKPVPYALARIPSKKDWRGNLAQGATGKVVALTKRDLEIAKIVAPFLISSGLHLVGLDVIGDYLTEINVTSPTCLCEIQQTTGLKIAHDYWQGFEM